MTPNNPYQNQPGEPVSLPPVPAMGQSQALPAANSPDQMSQPQPVIATDTTARAIAEARRLAIQYANDPFKLSEALNQLKTSYIAEEYQITTSSGAEH